MVLTCGQHLLVLFHIPTLLLATGTTHDDIVTVGRVCLHLDVVDTEVAFHPEPGEELEWMLWPPPETPEPLPTLVHHALQQSLSALTQLRSG